MNSRLLARVFSASDESAAFAAAPSLPFDAPSICDGFRSDADAAAEAANVWVSASTRFEAEFEQDGWRSEGDVKQIENRAFYLRVVGSSSRVERK